MSKTTKAIQKAERLLPGVPAPKGEKDARWQAIIQIADCLDEEPSDSDLKAMWEFIIKWDKHPSADVRIAISCCLLEELLGSDFKIYFPKVVDECQKSKRFASTFRSCWKQYQSEEPENLKAFKALQKEIDARG